MEQKRVEEILSRFKKSNKNALKKSEPIEANKTETPKKSPTPKKNDDHPGNTEEPKAAKNVKEKAERTSKADKSATASDKVKTDGPTVIEEDIQTRLPDPSIQNEKMTLNDKNSPVDLIIKKHSTGKTVSFDDNLHTIEKKKESDAANVQFDSKIEKVQVIHVASKTADSTDIKSSILQAQINNQESRSAFYAKTKTQRCLVPDNKTKWEIDWFDYKPAQYTDDSVLKNITADMDIDLMT
jgi:hypothetical protein